MDTLPQDLIRLITNFIRTSDCLLLSIETPDNQPYLDLVTVKARLKLALKEKNVGWIHQIIKYLENNDVLKIDHRSIVWLLLKYNFESILDYLYSLPHGNFMFLPESYYRYIDGKRGDMLKDNTNEPNKYMNIYIEGLSKGQHYELFDQYATTFSLVSSYIINFKDEEYIISKIKNTAKSGHNCTEIFEKSLNAKKFKVAQYLIDHRRNNIHINDCGISAYLIHTKQYDDKNYVWTISLKFSIYQACIDSNFEALNHIYDSFDDNYNAKSFKNLLSWSLMSKELHQYACEKFGLKVRLDTELINVINQLRDRIDAYKYFYNHIDAVEYSDDILEFIIISLLNHYIDKNDIAGFKAVYKIGIKFDILWGEKIFKAIKQPNFYHDVMFLIAYDLYEKLEPHKLKEKAKQIGIKNYSKMKKSELILTLIDGCC